MTVATKKKKKKLPEWEYCECGCHGHELNIPELDIYLWEFNDLKGNFELRSGHSWYGGALLGHFKSHREVNRFTKKYLSDKVKSIKKALKKLG